MRVYDDEKDDFTPEYQLQLAALCQMALACELIGNKIATALDVAGYKKSFIQERRQSLNRAKGAVQTILREYDYMFNDAFTRVFNAHGSAGYDLLYRYSNDIADLVMIYISRADASTESKSSKNMKKALLNFKQMPEYGDVAAVLKMYNFNTDNL